MNLTNIFNTLDLNVDLKDNNNKSARRGFIKQAGTISLKTVLAAIPLSALMMPKTARAETSSAIINTLNFALRLEYLEDEFYKMALDSSGLIPDGDQTVFMQISKHESEHVAYLKAALGSSAVPKPVFNFTAMGMFPNAFTDYPTFLTLSQAFEDTGVRAYKGQAGNLISDDAILTAALQIHSVEARHASEVRRLRGKRTGMEIQGWITGDESNGAPQASYDGEDNITHGGVNLDSIASLSNISMDSKTEAFDEPLTKDQVLAIVKPFILKYS